MSGKEEAEDPVGNTDDESEIEPTCTVAEVWVVSWYRKVYGVTFEIFESWQLAHRKFKSLYGEYKKIWQAFPHLPPEMTKLIDSFDTLQEGDAFEYPMPLIDEAYKLDMRKQCIQGVSGRKTKRARD